MVDEAWSLLGGTSADFIEGVARRARKYSGSLICATQSVEDFFTSKSTEAAWANSEWAILLKQKDSSIDALKSARRIRLTMTWKGRCAHWKRCGGNIQN